MSANFRKKKCIVPSCLRSTDDGVRIHRCGNKFEVIAKTLGKSTITKNSHICSLHFEGKCFSKKGTLNPDAVPTLLLDGPSEGIKRCGVPHCRSMGSEVPMFKGRQSFQTIGDEVGVDLTKGWVCAKHFEEECFDERGRLKSGVLPSLHFVMEDEDGNLNHITVRTIPSDEAAESSLHPTVEMMLSDDVVKDIVDDCQDVDVRAENSKLRVQLRRAHDDLDSMRKTMQLLRDDIENKKRRIDSLESELQRANSATRHFEVRIVKD